MGRLLERWIRRAAGTHDDIAIDLIPLAEPTAGGRAVAASRIKRRPAPRARAASLYVVQKKTVTGVCKGRYAAV